MSWTDIFPVLSDELVHEFQAQVTPEERLALENWLGVERIIPSRRAEAGNPKPNTRRRHLVSATLFWKHVQGADPDLPVPTRERLVIAKRLGLVKRFSPWTSCVEPLIDHTAGAVERHPDVTFRLYLARDLDFLVPTRRPLPPHGPPRHPQLHPHRRPLLPPPRGHRIRHLGQPPQRTRLFLEILKSSPLPP